MTNFLLINQQENFLVTVSMSKKLVVLWKRENLNYLFDLPMK